MSNVKLTLRKKRHLKVRKRILNAKELRPRLVVFRSLNHIYAQIIDDKEGKTLVSNSDMKLEKAGTKTEMAKKVGKEIAEKALANKIDTVAFDRNGYKYHGRVKALAEAAREAGLKF